MRISLTGLRLSQAQEFMAAASAGLSSSPWLHEHDLGETLGFSLKLGDYAVDRRLAEVSFGVWELRPKTLWRLVEPKQFINNAITRRLPIEFGYDVRGDGEAKTRIVRPYSTEKLSFTAKHSRGVRRYRYDKIQWLMTSDLSPAIDTQELTILVSGTGGSPRISLSLHTLEGDGRRVGSSPRVVENSEELPRGRF